MDYGINQENTVIINADFDFGYWLAVLTAAAAVFCVLAFLKWLVKYLAKKHSYHDHAVYLVRVPKEKPKDNDKAYGVQQLREEIAKCEIIFSNIGGLKAEGGWTSFNGWKAWFFGRSDHFSFEIVAHHKLIHFYATAPRRSARYLEQLVHAHFPEAVIEEVPDYNIFQPTDETMACYLKTKREFFFPLKTYNKMDVDPLNTVLNAMSKLNYDESIAVQYMVRSAQPGWHNAVLRFVGEVRKCNSVAEALGNRGFMKIVYFFGDLLKAAKPPEKNNLDSQKRLTPMEEEALKIIEEKNAKAGLDVNLRLVVSAKNHYDARNYLINMIGVFGQYNYYEYGNKFNNKANKVFVLRHEKRLLHDFIYRRFDSRIKFLVNAEEMNSLFHFPLRQAETPNILWLTAKHAAAPPETPDEGIILGKNVYRGVAKEIKIKRDDRRRHTYIIGKSGVGKSQLMANMAIQDVLNGEGLCVIDPHGDLIRDILDRVPAERAEDVVLFAPADTERPLALNLLEFDSRYPEQKTFVINEMIKIFDKLYDLKATGGPIFEQYMRNAMLLIMVDPESGSTLMEIPKVLADPDFRRLKLERCSDPTVVDFWRKEAEKAGGDAALANVIPYVTSKLTSFISNDTMRPIIGQQKSSFNLRDIMDRRKILLVDLTKGLIGEMNSYLLGMILVGKILMAALSRADMPQAERKDFYLYIDEFQNFTTDSICSILSEARKYSLNLIIAHQYLGQLVKNNDTSIKDAVFGNVGTWLLFKVGSEDAEKMEKEFSPVFNQFDLINIEKFTAYVKLLIDNTTSRPFSMQSPWPLMGVRNEDVGRKIKTLSRLKYGQDRNVIEAEIRRRTKAF